MTQSNPTSTERPNEPSVGLNGMLGQNRQSKVSSNFDFDLEEDAPKRRFSLKKGIIGLVIVGAIAGAGYAYSTGLLTAGQNAAATPTPVAAVKAPGKVIAEAKVVPENSASLSMSTGGIVAQVFVKEGDTVTAGQTLVRLESSKQEVAVRQAEAGLKRAQSKLDETKAGPRPEEIAVARISVEAAQAQLAKLKEPVRPEEVAAAQASVSAAQAQLSKASQGANEDLIVAAKNDLAKLKAGPSAEDVRAAEIAIEQAKSALWAAQTDRDGVCGNGAAPKYMCDSANARVSAAENQIPAAENQLAKAKTGAKTEDIKTAEARLDQLLKGPNSSDVAAARSNVDAASAKLQLAQVGPRSSDIAAAEVEIKRAQAQLELAQVGARPEAVAGAEADVATARAQLDQAKAVLAESELKAPFAGVIASFELKAGENVTPGTQLVRLADTSRWLIQTTDLTELNVVKLSQGSPVTLTFDALPGLEVPGKIEKIKTLGDTRQGDIVYTVTARPDSYDPRLRWNMTATLSAEPTAQMAAN